MADLITRQFVSDRAAGCCEYCMSQEKFSSQAFSIEHFNWNENYTVIEGQTPIGRATIEALKMNRDFLINQRIVFRAYGIHPPQHSVV